MEHPGIGVVMTGSIVVIGTNHHVDPGRIGRAVAVAGEDTVDRIGEIKR